MIAFDAASHTYTDTRSGAILPSVTQVLDLAGFTPAYRVDPVILATARERGSLIHEACAFADQGTLDWETLDPRFLPYVQAWQRFREAEGFEALVIEAIGYHPMLQYAGTLDRLGRFKTGRLAVVDLKTGSRVEADDPRHALQTAGYTMPGFICFPSEMAGIALPETPPEQSDDGFGRAIVHLKPNGKYQLYWHEDPEDYNDFIAAVRVARRVLRWGKHAERGLAPGTPTLQ